MVVLVRRGTFVPTLLVLLLGASAAEAATIRGTVRIGRSPLEGVSVYVWQHGGGFDAVARSGEDGSYQVWVPDDAVYNLAANKPGIEGHRLDLATASVDNVLVAWEDAVCDIEIPARAGAGFGIDLGAQTEADPGLLELVTSLGVSWVRINFVRRSEDPEWFRDYDAIVSALRERDIAIYGLINTEAVGVDEGPLSSPWDPAARDYAEAFARTALAIVGHFRGRIGVYELVNEPNNWNQDQVARVAPTWMALILQRTYEVVKLDHAQDSSWQVTLVSGAVFSFTDVTSTDYLAEVWDAGRRDHDWDLVRARCGSFPADGVGYHIYVLEEAGDRPDEVAPVYRRHLDAVEDFLRAHDPEGAGKRVWLSELGWRSAHGEEHQAEMLEAAFEALGADPRAALGLSFALQDFVIAGPDGRPQLEDWGLLRQDGSPKLAVVDRFRRAMQR